MSDEACKRCNRTLYFRAQVNDALPYSICAVCMGAVNAELERGRESAAEAMAAGFAQGVEATEARTIKRIDELVAALDKAIKDGVVWEAKASEYCQDAAEREMDQFSMRKRIAQLESRLEGSMPAKPREEWDRLEASVAELRGRLEVHSQIQAEVFAWRTAWKERADASRRIVNAAMRLSSVMGTKECPVYAQQDEAFTEFEMALADFAAGRCCDGQDPSHVRCFQGNDPVGKLRAAGEGR